MGVMGVVVVRVMGVNATANGRRHHRAGVAEDVVRLLALLPLGSDWVK